VRSSRDTGGLVYLKQGGWKGLEIRGNFKGWESGANPYETRRLGSQGLSLVTEPRVVL
jgi:hypothetical protein